MSRKRRADESYHRNGSVVELTQALYLNGKAMQEGPRRKNWSKHDLKYVKPLTTNQDIMFNAFRAGDNVFAHGTAGTGKSYAALYLALQLLLDVDNEYERIIIVRSTVPARDVGFLPGTVEEKLAVYEQPYRDIFADLIGKASSYDDMKEARKVEFVSTSFIRGITWDNAIIVFDEVQNANWEEINTVMTRIGNNTRLVICGDVKQNDLLYKKSDQSGIETLLKVTKRLPAFANVTFTRDDIVRSDFVKQFIIACEDLGV